MRKTVSRNPRLELERYPKSEKLILTAKKSMRGNLFIDSFIQECDVRYNTLKSGTVSAALKYDRMLKRMGQKIVDFGREFGKDVNNISFIFLNRFYPVSIKGKVNPLTQMTYFWNTFVIEITRDRPLFNLLNFSESKKNLILDIIEELKSCKKDERLKSFLRDHVKGYKIEYPHHFSERSILFETVLLMMDQIKDKKYSYYIENHAVEIIKAHAWYLKKFGDPVSLKLGNLIGELAMLRLKNYYDWSRRIELEKRYTFTDSKKIGQTGRSTEKQFDF